MDVSGYETQKRAFWSKPLIMRVAFATDSIRMIPRSSSSGCTTCYHRATCVQVCDRRHGDLFTRSSACSPPRRGIVCGDVGRCQGRAWSSPRSVSSNDTPTDTRRPYDIPAHPLFADLTIHVTIRSRNTDTILLACYVTSITVQVASPPP